MSRPVIAILASGEGTTAEAFIKAGLSGQVKTSIGLVITNNRQAGVLKRVEKLNQENGLDIKTAIINGQTHPGAANEKLTPGNQTNAEEAAILELLQKGDFDAIVLMGYMKKVGPRIVQKFGWQNSYSSPYQACLLNTHAGLFPETKGLFGVHKQEQVIKRQLPESGYTLHLVAEDYDDGPVIAEHKAKVKPGQTVESLLAQDQAIEKKYLPIDIEMFIKRRRARWPKS